VVLATVINLVAGWKAHTSLLRAAEALRLRDQVRLELVEGPLGRAMRPGGARVSGCPG